MNTKLMIDIVGWVGAVLLLLAYFLVSMKKCTGRSIFYQILNIIGSSFLVLNAGYYQAFPSVFVNIVWICIGVVTVFFVLKSYFREN
ncbi:MAG: hypothetical protein V2J62_06370 [candidate division KSB1 bacterium]|nr:hypothetical protein [candidate division KSB1 bacterium]